MSQEVEPPLVFISYSHDSPEHKKWVANLANKLMKGGVRTLFDQWDLNLGDDVAKFMERSVRQADRVLMVCTDAYVKKANDGTGGVGYEAMIVTGELVQDLGKAKFIPIVRQAGSTRPKLPSAVATRLYVDASNDDNFPEILEKILRELHKAPLLPKPTLGVNPFATDAVGPLATTRSQMTKSLSGSSTADVYIAARRLALADDVASWRNLVDMARAETQTHLGEWWAKYGNSVPTSVELIKQSIEGISASESLVAIALAGVGSGRAKFSNQVAIFEDIVMPVGWQRSGFTVRTDLPDATGFIFQAIHGALCLHTSQLSTAINFVREEIKVSGSSERRPVHKIPQFMGWPGALAEDSRISWQAVLKMTDRWRWLEEVFGSAEGYQRALAAYCMALSVNEYGSALVENTEPSFKTPDQLHLEVPTHFASSQAPVRRGAFRLLTTDPCAVCDIWRSFGIDDKRASAHWDDWLNVLRHWHRRSYAFSQDNFDEMAALPSYVKSRCNPQ